MTPIGEFSLDGTSASMLKPPVGALHIPSVHPLDWFASYIQVSLGTDVYLHSANVDLYIRVALAMEWCIIRHWILLFKAYSQGVSRLRGKIWVYRSTIHDKVRLFGRNRDRWEDGNDCNNEWARKIGMWSLDVNTDQVHSLIEVMWCISKIWIHDEIENQVSLQKKKMVFLGRPIQTLWSCCGQKKVNLGLITREASWLVILPWLLCHLFCSNELIIW